jgi:hypothetical protein
MAGLLLSKEEIHKRTVLNLFPHPSAYSLISSSLDGYLKIWKSE